MISIWQLVARGSSGDLTPGRTSDQVVEALGEPSDRSVLRPMILKYGPIELMFRDERLAAAAYYTGRDAHPQIVEDLPVAREELEALAGASRLELVADPALTDDDRLGFTVRRSGAVLIFERERLQSAQVPCG